MNAPATTEAAKAKKAAPELRTITMTDGRKVDFVGKKRLVKIASYIPGATAEDPGHLECRLDWENGETRLWKSPSFTAPAQVIDAACHGIEQKLGDESSGVEKTSDAMVKTDELLVRLNKKVGEGYAWNSRGTGESGASNVVVRALMELYSKSREEIMAILDTFEPAEKRALRQDPDLAPIIKRLEAEEDKAAAKKHDTKALLGRFTAPKTAPVNSVFAAGEAAGGGGGNPAPTPAAPVPPVAPAKANKGK